MNIKVKDLVNSSDIKSKIKNAVNGMDYKTTYLVEFGTDCTATVTEIDIVCKTIFTEIDIDNNEDLEIILRK